MDKESELYFDEGITAGIAEQEQNEKNFRVASILDRIIMHEVESLPDPLYVAELAGGAHPDRYDKLFSRLLSKNGKIDWVDFSEPMLKLAKKYLEIKFKERLKVLNFVKMDIFEYLESVSDNSLSLANMKYTFDHVEDIEKLFGLLYKKLVRGGALTATLSIKSNVLKARSTNAQYYYNSRELKVGEEITLKDGDKFSLRFFRDSGDHTSPLIKGQITKYYYSSEKIKEIASKFDFEIFIGNWKDRVPEEKQESEEMDQQILILKKN